MQRILLASTMAASAVQGQTFDGRVPVRPDGPVPVLPFPEEPVLCCTAFTAECAACGAGMSVEQFCSTYPDIPGCNPECNYFCPEVYDPVCDTNGVLYINKCFLGEAICRSRGRIEMDGRQAIPDGSGGHYCPARCCKAETVECLACEAGVTEEEYCLEVSNVDGCEKYEPVCCQAETATCLACSKKLTVKEYCFRFPRTKGCLQLGDACEVGDATEGLLVDRADECPSGTICKNDANSIDLRHPLSKHCVRICQDVTCDEGTYCRESSNTQARCTGEEECVPYSAIGESCGGFTLPCFQKICAPGVNCLTLNKMIADVPGTCSKCSDKDGTECFRRGGKFDFFDCSCVVEPLKADDVCYDAQFVGGVNREEDCPIGTSCRVPEGGAVSTLFPPVRYCLEDSCFFDGVTYEFNESFEKDCNTCRCGSGGIVTCTEKACLPKTCQHNGEEYQVGDKFKDDCNDCVCTELGPVCTEKFCLPKTCQHNGEEYQVGDEFKDDCNDCVCTEAGPVCTEKACPKTCQHNGEEYQVGDTFKIDCNTCVCTGAVPVCTTFACLPKTCQHNGEEYQLGDEFKDDCNDCVCTELGPACTKKLCLPKTCQHNGEEYQVGDKFKDDCNTCVCTEEGTVCTEKACQTCPYEYQRCTGHLICKLFFWDVSAKCVERSYCKPKHCDLNSQCDLDSCSESKCSRTRTRIGHCVIPSNEPVVPSRSSYNY